MKRWFAAMVTVLGLSSAVFAQEPANPGSVVVTVIPGGVAVMYVRNK